MDELNKRIVFQRSVPDVDNPVARASSLKFYNQHHTECTARLEQFKERLSNAEADLAARGASEAEIQSWKFSTTNEHIQLLEAAIRAKRNVEWMDKGLHELMVDKIKLLEVSYGTRV